MVYGDTSITDGLVFYKIVFFSEIWRVHLIEMDIYVPLSVVSRRLHDDNIF